MTADVDSGPNWGPWSLVATVFLLGGIAAVVAVVLSFPELPLSACTDVGYDGGEPPGGFQFYGFHWGWMAYSPDGGVNRCDTPIVSIAVALSAFGVAALGLDRR